MAAAAGGAEVGAGRRGPAAARRRARRGRWRRRARAGDEPHVAVGVRRRHSRPACAATSTCSSASCIAARADRRPARRPRRSASAPRRRRARASAPSRPTLRAAAGRDRRRRAPSRVQYVWALYCAHDLEERHWHLGPVGSSRACRARASAALMLAAFGAQMDDEGEVAWLETDKPENVVFYRRAGFERRRRVTAARAHHLVDAPGPVAAAADPEALGTTSTSAHRPPLVPREQQSGRAARGRARGTRPEALEASHVGRGRREPVDGRRRSARIPSSPPSSARAASDAPSVRSCRRSARTGTGTLASRGAPLSSIPSTSWPSCARGTRGP